MTEFFDSYGIEAYISGWVDLTPDVLTDPAPSWNMGIMDNSPTSRVGDPEFLNFSLNNSDRNSAGLIGYYSPGHANCMTGWDAGVNVRLWFVYDGEKFYKYYGKVMSGGITVAPGVYGKRSVDVICHGYMSQAAEHDLSLMTILLNGTIGDAAEAIIANMAFPPLATDIASGGDVMPTCFDSVRSNTTALAEMHKLAMSELSYIYTRGDKSGGQTFVVETRYTRSETDLYTYEMSADESNLSENENGNQSIYESSNYAVNDGTATLNLIGTISKTSATSTLVEYEDNDECINEDGTYAVNNEVEALDLSDAALVGMHPPSYGKNMANQIAAVTSPRRVDSAATTVLFATQERILLKAGETKEGFRGVYRDPAGGASYVNGRNMVDPPFSGTDYSMSANKDGTGTDLTSSLSVSVTFGTEAAEWTITNGGTQDGYVYLQARGKGIYTYDDVSVIVKDQDSIDKHGLRVLNFDLKYQNDPAKGESFAQYVLSQEKDPRKTIEDYPMFANQSATAMLEFLYGEPGKRGIFSESVNGIDGNYFIMGYSAKLLSGKYVHWSPVLQSAGAAFFVWSASSWEIDNAWSFPE